MYRCKLHLFFFYLKNTVGKIFFNHPEQLQFLPLNPNRDCAKFNDAFDVVTFRGTNLQTYCITNFH